MTDFSKFIEFQGVTWKNLKLYLEDLKKTKLDLLVSADTHDKSNQVRGAISVINQILALENNAANSAAQQESTNHESRTPF